MQMNAMRISKAGTDIQEDDCAFLDTFCISVLDDAVLAGVCAASMLTSPPETESILFDALMTKGASLSVNTIFHIPRSARLLMVQVLAEDFHNAVSNTLSDMLQFSSLLKRYWGIRQEEARSQFNITNSSTPVAGSRSRPFMDGC